jgi:LuxR family transcriptional regulator, regulator of acetate metabolism
VTGLHTVAVADTTLATQATEALAAARALLGDDALVPNPADDEAVEEAVNQTINRLSAALESRLNGDDLQLATTAMRLTALKHRWTAETIARGLDGLATVQRALARLRAAGSVDEMIQLGPRVACEFCGFQYAVLFRVDDDVMRPISAYSTVDDTWPERVVEAFARHAPVHLGPNSLETDMLRRRRPVIVHDVVSDPRVLRAGRAVETGGYVAAPVIPEGRVIGFLHGATGRTPDIVERDIISAFAEGYGYALERSILTDRLTRNSEIVRELMHDAEHRLGQLREAQLVIAPADEPQGSGSSPHPAATPFVASTSRVHQLLTRREIEIVELMAEGCTNREIAQRFVVSEGTVKSHVRNILRKMHATNRAEAVSRYWRLVEGH